VDAISYGYEPAVTGIRRRMENDDGAIAHFTAFSKLRACYTGKHRWCGMTGGMLGGQGASPLTSPCRHLPLGIAPPAGWEGRAPGGGRVPIPLLAEGRNAWRGHVGEPCKPGQKEERLLKSMFCATSLQAGADMPGIRAAGAAGLIARATALIPSVSGLESCTG